MADKGTVLIIEDEDAIADVLKLRLRNEGFRVSHAADGESGLARFTEATPRLVLVDVGLPGIDGFEVCRRIRARSQVPVIMLTARDEEISKVLGLELGADDYVTKPFSAHELLARVKAVLRRIDDPRRGEAQVIEAGDLVIDAGRREVRRDGEVHLLTAREFELLWYLAENLGLVLSREQILRAVWGFDWFGETRTVDVHIRQIRKKLGDDIPIRTVWGVGYQLLGERT